jgi:hypothetical protein
MAQGSTPLSLTKRNQLVFQLVALVLLVERIVIGHAREIVGDKVRVLSPQ